jgi:hypothetical protein
MKTMDTLNNDSFAQSLSTEMFEMRKRRKSRKSRRS